MRDQQELDWVKHDIEELRQKEGVLPQIRADVDNQITHERERLSSCENVIQYNDKVFQAVSSRLEANLSQFRRALGLEFRKNQVNNAIVFVFTSVDIQDPGREFCFTLAVESDQQYRVSECKPLVPELQAHIDELNQSQGEELARFVAKMRRAFLNLSSSL